MALKNNLKLLNFLYKLLADDREKLGAYSYSLDKKPTFKTVEDTHALVRSTPRAEGMSNAQFKHFFETVNSEKYDFHNILCIKNGRVVAEASYAPYEPKIWSVTHSLCKTITALAIGMAIDEGYFKLNDNVYELLKGKRRFYTSGGMKRLTVKHLLTMTSGVNFKEANIVSTPNWSEAFLSSDFTFAPGERFEYNSMNTYMLAVIIYHTTGKTLMEFLEPRLFVPLGIHNVSWEKGPEGVEKAGWGMYIAIEDLGKIGQLVLQLGEWNVQGEVVRLVSRAWMQDMLKPQIRTSFAQSYGYQIWVDPGGRYYCFSGLFGQMIYVNPEYQFVVVVTAGNDSVFNNEALIKTVTQIFCTPSPALSEAEDIQLSELDDMIKTFVSYSPPLLSPVVITMTNEVQKVTLKQKLLSNMRRVFRTKQEETSVPIIMKQYPLPDVIVDILHETYHFGENNVGLLPVMLQMMDNNFTQGLEQLSFYEQDGKLHLRWTNTTMIWDIPIGLYEPLNDTLNISDENFLISSFGYVTRDEDNNVVLKVTICFLETSSVRYLKCFFMNDNQTIKLELDESPSIARISKTVLVQASENELPSFLAKDNGYVRFLIDKLTLPVIVGHKGEGVK